MFKLKGKRVLITGASAGIGEACAREFANNGANLVLTGRRADRLEALASELKAEFKVEVETLVFDIADRQQTEKALSLKSVDDVSILINNAGLALGADSLQTAKLDDLEQMIDTNIKGLLYVTRILLPKMIAKGEGHIVNLGSVAGRAVYPGGAVYAATKFAVRAINDSLRMDLLGTPIRVTNISPGMVETEFSKVRFRGDEAKADNVYKNMNPLTPVDIAETILWCVNRPAHVNIQEIIIMPTDQAAVGPYVHRRT
jgi:3-hydroxy acid dehydrogenase/malonic semialdehyde reductase